MIVDLAPPSSDAVLELGSFPRQNSKSTSHSQGDVLFETQHVPFWTETKFLSKDFLSKQFIDSLGGTNQSGDNIGSFIADRGGAMGSIPV